MTWRLAMSTIYIRYCSYGLPVGPVTKNNDAGNVPANSTAQAITAALDALGTTKIVMASPYTPETNELEAHCW